MVLHSPIFDFMNSNDRFKSIDTRYTCSHMSCLTAADTVYYATWTALQHHVRTAHPPTCPYPACNGRVFSAQKGLRAHLKLHEHREAEEGIQSSGSDAEDDRDEPPRKKRRGGEVGRDWICDIESCKKDFKSVSILLPQASGALTPSARKRR